MKHVRLQMSIRTQSWSSAWLCMWQIHSLAALCDHISRNIPPGASGFATNIMNSQDISASEARCARWSAEPCCGSKAGAPYNHRLEASLSFSRVNLWCGFFFFLNDINELLSRLLATASNNIFPNTKYCFGIIVTVRDAKINSSDSWPPFSIWGKKKKKKKNESFFLRALARDAGFNEHLWIVPVRQDIRWHQAALFGWGSIHLHRQKCKLSVSTRFYRVPTMCLVLCQVL